ncbi:GBS Bsp-like repeat-containing protein [Streptococcus alactolyticus]|uniref:GBS Bsp-like repeat-containing protein n=1 Tax=Streptococcus alactolyticus TaxID=29389 RepID=UPI003D022BD7
MSKLKTALLSTVVLGATCLSHPVFADQQGNAIVSKTNFDSASKTFEVTAQQSDNGKAIKGINVAIWSEENGQNDLKWYTNSNVSGGKSRFNLI